MHFEGQCTNKRLACVQAGVVGLLKGSQVARFALPAPEASPAPFTAASSAPAVPAPSPPSAASGHQVDDPSAPRPPPGTTPKHPTSATPTQHEPASSASTPPSVASTSAQQPREAHSSDVVPSASAQTGAADARSQASASISGSLSSHVKDTPKASAETQPTASQGAEPSVSIRPDSSSVQPQQRQQSYSNASADEGIAEAVNADSSSALGHGKKAAKTQEPNQVGVAQSEGHVGPAEAVASDTAGSSVHGGETQLEAAGTEPASDSRKLERAHGAEEQEQPGESPASESGSALTEQQPHSGQETDPDVHTRGDTSSDAIDPSAPTDADAESDRSLVPQDKAEGKHGVASISNAVMDPGGGSEGSRDRTCLHGPSPDSSSTALSASQLASDDQAGPDESEQQRCQGAQQQVQQVSQQATAPSSAQATNPILSSQDAGQGQQQQPPATPPAAVPKEVSSSQSVQQESDPSEAIPAAASSSQASVQQTEGRLAVIRAPAASLTAAVKHTAGRKAEGLSQTREQAVPGSGAVDSVKLPADAVTGEEPGVASGMHASRVSTVSRTYALSEATRSHAAASSASARDANRQVNELQDKKTEAHVLSPKGTSKSRQTAEMKRQQTSFNPLG